MSSTYTHRRTDLADDSIPILALSPIHFSNRTFPNCLSHNKSARGWPYRFHSNKASWCKIWTFEGTQSILFKTLIIPWDRLFGPWSLSQFTTFDQESELCFQGQKTIRSHKSRAGIPSNLNPASKEMISDSVELWETAVCFLHIQLLGTSVWLPKTHNVPPEVDVESSRSPAKSESWNSPNLHCFAVLPTWQYCLFSHVWWMCNINRLRRLSQALVHFVIDRASLFAEHRISGLPIRPKYKHFRTIWEHTCDNSPTDWISSSSKCVREVWTS